MAKKAGSKKLFKKVMFNIDEFPYCCGIGVPCGFDEEQDGYDYWTGKAKRARKYFETREQQAEDILKRVLEENQHNTKYNYLIITLVSNYKNKGPEDRGQFPEFQDLLISDGWTINQVFLNPNHGNELTVFSKYFPDIEYNENTDEEDEMW